MFIVSYEKEGQLSWGIAYPDRGILYPVEAFFGEKSPKSVLDFIKEERTRTLPLEPLFNIQPLSLDSVRITAPIPVPLRNIYCIGRNYLDHIKELSQEGELPAEFVYPNFFTKATSSINGPYDSIPTHQDLTSEIDYEVELAVIIGRTGVNIPEALAMEYIFGYTILNDITARDVQRNHFQWFKGKSLDGFCPMGPWIVTKDQIPDPAELNLASFVNNEPRQQANTRLMIFKIAKLIHILSQGLTLRAGDILATGTPSGVGMGYTPPRLLKKGDSVRCEIEGIGFIENKVGE